MFKHFFKSGKVPFVWHIFFVMMLILGACSKGSDEPNQEPTPGPTPTKLNFTLTIVSPEMESTLLASSTDGSQVDTKFYSHFNDGGTKRVLAKQNGKIVDLGSYDVTLLSTSGEEGRIEVDATDKLSADNPYDLYIIGGSYRWDNGDVYYRKAMSRKDIVATWLKLSSSSIPQKAKDNLAGTGEILFVINKSGAPIKFKHKGFDAANKWYYNYAEVSLDNGSVVKSEDGEAESDEKEIPVFTGENAEYFYSTYVPNGNLINDAQLIAEIDGKEVRSSNRISSNITIQTNHSYAMFAVWDGEKLLLGDGEGDPVVIVCSDEAGSGIIVDEVKSDGTVILSASSTTIPKEGEIIVSSITDAAPRGFLYRVEKVQQSGGKIIIKTSPAYLNEVLKDAHVEQPLIFRESTHTARAHQKAAYNSQAYVNGATSRSEDNLFKWKNKYTIFDVPGGTISILGNEMKEYVKGEVSLGLNLGGSFIWDSDGFIPNRCGFTLNGSVSVSVTIEAGIKSKYEKKLVDIDLEPIVFPVGVVPVVIFPEIQWKYGIKTAGGKIYAKWKPIDIDMCGFDVHVFWNKEADANDSNWDCGASTTSDFSDWSWKSFFQDMLNLEVGLEGEVKFSVWPELIFKLYNMENVALSTTIEPYAKLKGELAVKWKANDWNWDDFELKDNLSLSLGLENSYKGKLEFNIFGEPIGGELSSEITLFNNPLIEGATLMPVFNDFQIYPKDNAINREYVNVSAKKGAVLLTLFYDREDDYGFCISQVKKDLNGKELPREWKFYSLKSKYEGSSYGLDRELKIELDIPTSSLQRAATYEIRPYTVIKMGGKQYVFKRKGGKFYTGGGTGDGGVTIIDVPGFNL